MESNVELREAAVLRGTIAVVEAAHGEAPGLQVQAPTEAHLHRGRQEDAHLRVQVADAAAAAGDEAALVSRQRSRNGFPVARRLGHGGSAPPRIRSRSFGEAVGLAPCDDAERRSGSQLGPPVLLLSPGQHVADRHHELLPGELGLDRRLRRESQTPRRGLNRSSGSAAMAARSFILGSSISVEARPRAVLVTGDLEARSTGLVEAPEREAVGAGRSFTRERRRPRGGTFSKSGPSVSNPRPRGCDITIYFCAIVRRVEGLRREVERLELFPGPVVSPTIRRYLRRPPSRVSIKAIPDFATRARTERARHPRVTASEQCAA